VLERLSWKRLALELFLCCIPALILGAFWVICRGFCWRQSPVSDLAFLEFDAPFLVAVGRP
jgi:two-component system phosphate regulon sensor histidine kinase PhoR